MHLVLYGVEVDQEGGVAPGTPPFVALRLKQQLIRLIYKERLEQLSPEKKASIDYHGTMERLKGDDFNDLGPLFQDIYQLCQED